MKLKLWLVAVGISLAATMNAVAHEGHQHTPTSTEEMEKALEAERKSVQTPTSTGIPDTPIGPAVAAIPEVGNQVCPVSGDPIAKPGEKLAMGETIKYEYKGKIYNLCCLMCVKDFKKNPEKYSKKALEEAAQPQK